VTAEDHLQTHLRAIATRNLDALARTVDPEEIVLVAADGTVTTDTATFLERHAAWFDMPGWTLDWELLHARRDGDVATYLLALDYREGETRVPSILSLMFARRDDDEWLLVQDQNTPLSAEQADASAA
jgi:ketosteroid isomerase-like protein